MSRPSKTIIALDTETYGDGEAFIGSYAYRKDGKLLSGVAEPSSIAGFVDNTKHFVAVFHNAKFDLQALRKARFPVKQVHRDSFEDTEIMAHLLNEHDRKGLKYLARTQLGIDTKEEQALKDWMRKNKYRREQGYQNIDPDILHPYAIKDAEYTLLLYEHFLPKLEASSMQLQQMYNMDKDVCLAVTEIEMNGMRLDKEYIAETYKEYNGKLVLTLMDLREMTNDEFNPASPKQVREVLADRGIDVETTAEGALLPYLEEDEFVERLLEYRRLAKLTNTYLGNLKDVADKSELFFPNFRLNKTVTGRMASGKVEE